MKQDMIKLIEDMKEEYIDQWGVEPTTVYMSTFNIEALEKLGIVGEIAGLTVCADSSKNIGEITFGGKVGERH